MLVEAECFTSYVRCVHGQQKYRSLLCIIAVVLSLMLMASPCKGYPATKNAAAALTKSLLFNTQHKLESLCKNVNQHRVCLSN